MNYRLVSSRSFLPLYLPSRLQLGLQGRESWTFRPNSFINPSINIKIGTIFCSSPRNNNRCNVSSSRSGLDCSDVPKIQLWIDTDAGVDDALAIALALSHPTVDVVGISVVRGNVDVAQGLVNVGRVLLTTAEATPLNINLGAAPGAGAGYRCDASAEEGIVQAAPESPSSQQLEQPFPLPRACQPHAHILPGGTSSRVFPAPAFTFQDVPVCGGADTPLASPPQSLTYYYGRDGLGDVPGLDPAESSVRITLFGGGGPRLAGNMSTSRNAADRNSVGSGDAGSFHAADIDLIDGSAQPISNAASAAAAAAAAEAASLGGSGGGLELSAVEALLTAARGNPGQLVVVALGPLTNLASALRIEPQLPSLLRALLVLGGGEGEYDRNVTPYAEFNFHADPEAAAEVVRGFGGASSNCRRGHISNGASGLPLGGMRAPEKNPGSLSSPGAAASRTSCAGMWLMKSWQLLVRTLRWLTLQPRG
ncbi:hypothetical protein VaNZ11_002898 [Volvox africanus]|uniref:Inosine/uridine-preferring nucleoside hydrolase domain-containing protein n=1 Tax=Volvox africanus TaxID=51714 RepID=A0ABQ5RTZ9_9CHLO|nr:hypothetical protein VaNZ11_002898 [Volvox africanus]